LFTIFADALHYEVPAHVSSWLVRRQRIIKEEFRSRPPSSFQFRFTCNRQLTKNTILLRSLGVRYNRVAYKRQQASHAPFWVVGT
jgi:hypothetical protein